jgi:DNA-binding transcriptional regulator YdaS (Cro superfamily)
MGSVKEEGCPEVEKATVLEVTRNDIVPSFKEMSWAKD